MDPFCGEERTSWIVHLGAGGAVAGKARGGATGRARETGASKVYIHICVFSIYMYIILVKYRHTLLV